MKINCDKCGVEFNKKPSDIKICQNHYCSRECSNKGMRIQLGKEPTKRKPLIYNKNKVVFRTPDDVKRRLLNSARQRCREKNIPLDVDNFTFLPDIPKFCPILGIEICLNNIVNSRNSPSLDRIVPELGYTVGNLRFISNRANTLKNNATLEELRLIYEDALKLEKEKGNE